VTAGDGARARLSAGAALLRHLAATAGQAVALRRELRRPLAERRVTGRDDDAVGPREPAPSRHGISPRA
jgi:hypothetical protein